MDPRTVGDKLPPLRRPYPKPCRKVNPKVADEIKPPLETNQRMVEQLKPPLKMNRRMEPRPPFEKHQSKVNAKANYGNSIFTSLEDINAYLGSPDFQNFIQSVQYPGFDPRRTCHEMVRKFKAWPSSGKNKLNSLEEDVIYLVNLFLKEGNNIYAISKKMSARDRVKAEHLQRKYRIVPSAKDERATSVITLARIAGAFPIITAKILVSTPEDELTRPFTAGKMKALIAGYPKVLMCHAIASIIPRSLDEQIVKAVTSAICCYSAIEVAIINRNLQNLAGAARKAAVYVTTAHQSLLMDEKSRMAVCKNQNIFGEVFGYSDDGEISSVTDPVKTAAEFYEKIVDEKFTHDDLQKYL